MLFVGGVQCWGSNSYGALGGASNGKEIRNVFAAGDGATAVAAGGEHSCAVVNGGLKCWGLNEYGQLGNGTTSTGSIQGIISDTFPPGRNVTAVAAGIQHTCAIVNGGVQCWGNKGSGRLGSGEPPLFATPTTTMASGSNVTSLTAGNSGSACAVKNGGLWCWGTYVNFAQSTVAVSNTPVSVFPPAQIVTDAANSDGYSCAIIGGRVYCRGSNSDGQLGNNAQPEGQPALLPAGQVSAVTVGVSHACAILDGGVQCWGNNSGGQLGNNSAIKSPVPVIAIAAGSGATGVSARQQNSCAVVNGGVQCWGPNDSGRLGNNSTMLGSPIPVVAIAAGSGATAVAVGVQHACAVVNGGVQCWGDNAGRQLGGTLAAFSRIPLQTIPAGSGATAVAANRDHTCAVVSGGVQCWGTNAYGQLGNNTSGGPSAALVTAIPAGSNVAAITVGDSFTCAALNGGVVCWGNTDKGRLANGLVVGNQMHFPTITSATPPSAPAITTTSTSPNSITLNFTPPASNGSTITSYRAICSQSGNAVGAIDVPGTATEVTIGALAPGTYACNLTAYNIAGPGPASTTVSVTIAVVVNPPTVSITAPANNASLAQGLINIAVSAQAVSGTLTKLDVYDGAVLLPTVTTPAVNAYTYTYGWTGMAIGSHNLTVKATNTLGGTKVSAPVVVQVIVPPTPPSISLSTLSNFYLAGSSVDLNATATAAGTATITRVEFFANNGSTNTLIGTVTTAPYNFRWLNVAAGNYAITAKATDSLGIGTTSQVVSVTVAANVSIQFAAGLNGSTVNEDFILVSGTVNTISNSAININGKLATVTKEGQFFLNDLNLQAGANTVTATVTTADGQTATQTITINRSANVPLFEVGVGQGGIVIPGTPVDVDVTIASAANMPFATINIDCVSPSGGADVTQLGTYQCAYANAGTHDVRVTVKNAGGNTIYAAVKRVTVKSAEQHVLNVKAVYSTVIDRLLAGDKDAALKLFFSQAQVKYAQIFADLGTNLGTAAAQFGSVSLVSAGDRTGEVVVVRNVAGEQRVFMAYLMLGEDGVWRIESM